MTNFGKSSDHFISTQFGFPVLIKLHSQPVRLDFTQVLLNYVLNQTVNEQTLDHHRLYIDQGTC